MSGITSSTSRQIRKGASLPASPKAGWVFEKTSGGSEGFYHCFSDGSWTGPVSGAGIGGSTGATDNAILRANGTGGATIQSSAVTVDDNGSQTIPSAEQYKISTDAGLGRNAAGILKATNGSSGLGSLVVVRSNGGGLLFGGTTATDAGVFFMADDSIAVIKGDGSAYRAFSFANATSFSASAAALAFNASGGGPQVGSLGQYGFGSSATGGASASDTALGRNAAGVVEVNNGTLGTLGDILARTTRTTAVAFASLPASPVEGMVAAVTDSSTATWGATITGGGANHVLGYFNGSAWTVIGK